MIVPDIATAKLFLPSLNLKNDSPRMDAALTSAQADIVNKILGEDIETILEGEIYNPDVHLQLIYLVRRAICESAYLEFIAELDLQLSEAGFVVASNEAMTPASRQRVDELIKSMRSRKTSSWNNLVVFLMEKSKSDGSRYEDWRSTEQFNYLTSGIENNIASSRFKDEIELTFDQFYDMIPRMENVLMNEIASYLSYEYVYELREKYRDNSIVDYNETRVLNYVKTAVIAGVTGKMNYLAECCIMARKIMCAHKSTFPAFIASDEYLRPDNDLGKSSIVNLL